MYKKIADEVRTKKDGSTETIEATSIRRTSDNALIPFDEDNIDYRAYLAWVAEGNTPAEAD